MNKTSQTNWSQIATTAVIGAVIAWVGLAFGFGWMSPGTHRSLVDAALHKALVPVCADRMIANAEVHSEFLKTSSSWSRGELVRKHVPDVSGYSVNYSFSSDCAEAVAARSKTAAK